MKIYIIGPVGSGKTTLSKKISQKYKIKYYELDKVIWNDDLGVKRSQNVINNMFNDIISTESWIIEDVGRDIFKSAYEKADIIYYIKLNEARLYSRIIKRWIKQKLRLESYNYKPTFKNLLEMFKWAKHGIKKQNAQINELEKYNLIILSNKDVNKGKY